MMKRFSFLMIFIIGTYISKAQVAENYYRLYLTDKNYNTFSIDKPEEFLSQQALDRRLRQNIEINNSDLPISKTYLDSLQKMGLKIHSKSNWLNTVVVFTTDQDLIDTINNIGFVKSTEKSTSRMNTSSHKRFLEKKDFSTSTKINDPVDYGNATTQISMLNGYTLHQNGFSGQGKTIAVIDGGFYNVDLLPAFDSLWSNGQILGTKDFVDGDNQVFDASSHGMKVLSTMGANIPGELVGTAPKANYWLLRSEETASEYSIEEDNWVAAAEFADSIGVDIITSSLGYTEFDDTTQNYNYSDMDGNTTFITQAADIAASKGILVVNSAGNSANDPWKYISAPADGDSVLTVGAVDAFEVYASFSGQGPTFDGRIKPNVVAMGYQAAVQDIDGMITFANGTSFSAPIIAGMAACLWQYYPDLNNMQIIRKIEESAHQYSNPDYKMGYGIPNFGKAANLTNTNITTFMAKPLINVYPNPFSEYINIDFIQKTEETISVELYNITGTKIQETKQLNGYRSISITGLKNLPSGIYLLKINTHNQSIQKRLIKGQ